MSFFVRRALHAYSHVITTAVFCSENAAAWMAETYSGEMTSSRIHTSGHKRMNFVDLNQMARRVCLRKTASTSTVSEADNGSKPISAVSFVDKPRDVLYRRRAGSTTYAISDQRPLIREEYGWYASGVPSDKLNALRRYVQCESAMKSSTSNIFTSV